METHRTGEPQASPGGSDAATSSSFVTPSLVAAAASESSLLSSGRIRTPSRPRQRHRRGRRRIAAAAAKRTSESLRLAGAASACVSLAMCPLPWLEGRGGSLFLGVSAQDPTGAPTVSVAPTSHRPSMAPATSTPTMTSAPTVSMAPSTSNWPSMAPTTNNPTVSDQPTLAPSTLHPTNIETVNRTLTYVQELVVLANSSDAKSGELNDAEVDAFERVIASYTSSYGEGYGPDLIITTCNIIKQEIISEEVIPEEVAFGGHRTLHGYYTSTSSQHQSRSLQLGQPQKAKTLKLTYSVTWKSKYFRLSDYTLFFRDFINANNETVSLDLRRAGILKVDEVGNTTIARDTAPPTPRPPTMLAPITEPPVMATLAPAMDNPAVSAQPTVAPSTRHPTVFEGMSRTLTYVQDLVVLANASDPNAGELNDAEKDAFETVIASYTQYYGEGKGPDLIITTCSILDQVIVSEVVDPSPGEPPCTVTAKLHRLTFKLTYRVTWESRFFSLADYTIFFGDYMNANIEKVSSDLRLAGILKVEEVGLLPTPQPPPTSAPSAAPTLSMLDPTTAPATSVVPSQKPTVGPMLTPTPLPTFEISSTLVAAPFLSPEGAWAVIVFATGSLISVGIAIFCIVYKRKKRAREDSRRTPSLVESKDRFVDEEVGGISVAAASAAADSGGETVLTAAISPSHSSDTSSASVAAGDAEATPRDKMPREAVTSGPMEVCDPATIVAFDPMSAMRSRMMIKTCGPVEVGRDIMRQLLGDNNDDDGDGDGKTDDGIGRNAGRPPLSPRAPPQPLPPEYLDFCTDGFAESRTLGEGSFGKVYLGKDPVLRRKFAVKRMRLKTTTMTRRNDSTTAAGRDGSSLCSSSSDANPSMVHRARRAFERELEALSRFACHPNVARLYGYFLSDDLSQQQCLVFELASRGSLSDVLRQHRDDSGGTVGGSSSSEGGRGGGEGLHWTRRVRIALDIASALEYLHSGDRGHILLHRDIKSANVCLKRDWTALLIDCGVSRMIPRDESRTTLTIMDSTGNGLRGTSGYICPALLMGGAGDFTTASDIFSLGVVLVELFTGIVQHERLRDGTRAELFTKYGIERFNLKRDDDANDGGWTDISVRRDFAELALRCISHTPGSRPSASEVRRTLSELEAKSRPQAPAEANCIAVLASDPLVWADKEDRLHPVTRLNFERETEVLAQCVSEAGRDVNVLFEVATVGRLRAAARRRCVCLHFSGHGHPNALIFEDMRGGAHWVNSDSLLQDSGILVHGEPFKFVVVSACHSRSMGEAFVNAGVPHVLCCEKDEDGAGTLDDDVAIAFVEAFYPLLIEGYTIQAAYDSSRRTTSTMFSAEKCEKWILLPRESDHNCRVFDAGPVEWRDTPRRKQRIPPPPKPFVGRQVEMHTCLGEMLKNRFVTVVGEEGMGCSRFLSALCTYVDLRKRHMLGVDELLLVRSEGHSNDFCCDFVKPLHKRLVAEGRASGVLGKEEATKLDYYEKVCEALTDLKALLVFDKVNPTDKEAHNFFLALLERAPATKVLVAARRSLEFSAPGVTQRCLRLKPLCREDAVALFVEMCPSAETTEEKAKLKGIFLTSSEANYGWERKQISRLISAGIPRHIVEAAGNLPAEAYESIMTETPP